MPEETGETISSFVNSSSTSFFYWLLFLVACHNHSIISWDFLWFLQYVSKLTERNVYLTTSFGTVWWVNKLNGMKTRCKSSNTCMWTFKPNDFKQPRTAYLSLSQIDVDQNLYIYIYTQCRIMYTQGFCVWF